MAVCVAIVAVSAFFDPLTGKCGTGPYLMFQMFGALLADAVHSLCAACDDRGLRHAAAVLVNVGFYAITIALLYLKGHYFLRTPKPGASTSRAWFVPALLTWTALYLASYFFLFPATSCP